MKFSGHLINPSVQFTATLSANIGEYSKTSATETSCHMGKTSFFFSTISLVNIVSYSRFDQPPFFKKLGVRIRTHLWHSLSPCSMLSRKLSPTLREYSSYQTGV